MGNQIPSDGVDLVTAMMTCRKLKGSPGPAGPPPPALGAQLQVKVVRGPDDSPSFVRLPPQNPPSSSPSHQAKLTPMTWDHVLWDPAAQLHGGEVQPQFLPSRCRDRPPTDQFSEEMAWLHQAGFATGADGMGLQGAPAFRRPPFEVWLLRAGPHWSSLGILASADEDSKLHIDEIRPCSLIAAWNAMQQDDVQVRAGDRILAINEAIDAEGMMVEIRCQKPGAYMKVIVEPAPDPPIEDGFANPLLLGCGQHEHERGCPMDSCGGPGLFSCGYYPSGSEHAR